MGSICLGLSINQEWQQSGIDRLIQITCFGHFQVGAGVLTVLRNYASSNAQRIENPRVGGSIPPPGTIFTNNNSDLAYRNTRLSCVIQKHTINTLFAVLLAI